MIRRSKYVLIVLTVVVAALWAATPTRLDHVPVVVAGEDVLGLAQDIPDGLVTGTEKRITWADRKAKTSLAVVALHGFSASRQETAPLAEKIAKRLGANLFETRLAGHGLRTDALTNVRAEDWLNDVAEALEVGAQLGENVILVGTSTGATLALAMLDDERMAVVETFVFLSPNIAPKDTDSKWLTRPARPWLTRLLVGERRSWKPHNALQGKYWSTDYPIDAAVEMMRLVDRANSKLPTTIMQRMLVFFSDDDQVVSVPRIREAYAMIDSPHKALVHIRDPGDPSHHVLAGDILSPVQTDLIAERIIRFVTSEGRQ